VMDIMRRERLAGRAFGQLLRIPAARKAAGWRCRPERR
jgi:hypothetical protein